LAIALLIIMPIIDFVYKYYSIRGSGGLTGPASAKHPNIPNFPPGLDSLFGAQADGGTVGNPSWPGSTFGGHLTTSQPTGLWLLVRTICTMYWTSVCATPFTWIGSIFYCALELTVGTMYIARGGWVFLDESKWGKDPRVTLGDQDSNLRNLGDWGLDRQLTPQWVPPRHGRRGFLVDLRNQILVKTIVNTRPNALVPLAVHGSGITCMLLCRPHNHADIAHKAGMASLPPYILAQTVKSGTLYVGAPPKGDTSATTSSTPAEKVSAQAL